ncbi:MAG: hydroxymethylbilane synthase [Gemmataceae bacterium]|nr:hydroxymethylbilane synthase [Gemmataceae bacterium]
MTDPLRIGTRGSNLALWQANHVASLLRAAAPGLRVELIEIETAGDQVRDVPLVQLGGQGAFTKEIQKALQAGTVDVAVHSLKDLPTFTVEGLILAAVPSRGPVGDAFISSRHVSFAALPPGAVVATSSLRRRAQVLQRRPDLRLVDMRGNVETRLRKLDEQGLDALILAEAGLERLGLRLVITEILDPAWMLPAVGQGALGLECREADTRTRDLLAKLDDPPTHRAVLAERALLRGLGGGCQVPVGAHTTTEAGTLALRGVVISPDGRERVEGQVSGPAEEAETLGQRLAEELLGRGARELLGGRVP